VKEAIMPSAIEQWLITGMVTDEVTGQSGCGFEVRIYDKDISDDQHLGNAYTNETGRFKFTFSLADIADNYWRFWGISINFRERYPDLYFKIYYHGALVADLSGDVHWNQKDKEFDVLLSVPFPAEAIIGKCVAQDVYLKIEPVLDYSPVNPETGGGYSYRRDCFRRPGHEDGTISEDESNLKKFTALVYRQYTDDTYTTMVPDKLIATDLSEPSVARRIPSVIYTRPGRRLRIHVLNGDDAPHSLHMHGLQYGIDSDGAHPLGVTDKDGVRSDAICPGKCYTYEYDVTLEMTGCWPFHDHFMALGDMARIGLIGGVVVRDPCWPETDLEVPIFMHAMAGRRAAPLFDSGNILPGGSWPRMFDTVGPYHYECFFHGVMQGTITVEAGGAASATVTVTDHAFTPADITIEPGATVTWINAGASTHTVTENAASASGTSASINGRSHAGNTPVIEMTTGEKIRWYVFNHDFRQGWHNFHAHASHWSFGGLNIDNQSIGPAESFVVNTVAPPVVLPPCDEQYKEGNGQEYDLASLHPVHCHVESHVMAGMVCLIRIRQTVFLADAYVDALRFPLPLDPGTFVCPDPAPPDLCVDDTDSGSWQTLTPSPAFAVHSAVLRSGKVIMWSGHAELGPAFGTVTALYDPATDSYNTVPFSDSDDLFCAGHTFLPDGRLMAGGGANPGQVDTTHIFDPVVETWSHLATGQMNNFRWYPTMLAMNDGRTAILSGTPGGGVVADIEVIDMSAVTPGWQTVAGGSKPFSGLYPGFHWLPSGGMFFTRTGWNSHALATNDVSLFNFTGPAAGAWTDLAPMIFPDRKEGASVLLIDDTGPSPVAKVFVAGGQAPGQPAIKECEIIDISDPATTPGWVQTADMGNVRIGIACIALPNGKVMVVGGRQTSGRFDASPVFVLVGEIYDPATDKWAVTPPMSDGRQYHSSVVLLPDARVFASGGVDSSLGFGAAGNQQTAEAYSPEYLTLGARPVVTAAPATVSYGATVIVDTPSPADIASVCLIAPGAATHHTDTHQRYIRIGHSQTAPTQISVEIPSSNDVAPPGYYMLFLVDTAGAPSIAHFIQVG